MFVFALISGAIVLCRNNSVNNVYRDVSSAAEAAAGWP